MEEYYGQIYAIINQVNQKVYIGMTKGKDVLKDRYGSNLYKNTHNYHLKYSIEKYGIENFKIDTLCYATTYGSFKLSLSQYKIFNEQIYKDQGIYIYKIEK